jgi:hypothetical protein
MIEEQEHEAYMYQTADGWFITPSLLLAYKRGEGRCFPAAND